MTPLGAEPRRRDLIQVCAVGVAAALLATRAARAAEKQSQKQAKYQDHPEDIRMCATCSFFEKPAACSVVEGTVSPQGWCDLFALVD